MEAMYGGRWMGSGIYEISKLVSAQFGKEAEPVVPRLVKYIQILYQNKFIGYVKQK